MASFGAQFPNFSKIVGEPDNALPTYGGATVLGRLIKADIAVTLASGKLFADDGMAESVEEFSSATITLETDDMTDDVASTVYGCEVKEKEACYKAGDTAPLGGLAYYKVLVRKGKKLFKGYFYPRVKAALGNDTAQTKADSITFGTNTTTFSVFKCNTDAWRITKEFESEDEARAWVQEKLSAAGGA